MSLLASIVLSTTLLTSNPITEQANMSVLVQNLNTGEVIDSLRPDNVVPPASVMKVLTTAAALEQYGADYRIPTVLEYTGTIKDSTLRGNLYIRGNCDPSLGSQRRMDMLDPWVKAVRDAGIRRIEGAVVADMTMLDEDAHNPSWLYEDVANYYAPGIFALNYFNNTLSITLSTGAEGSFAKVVSTYPQVEGLNIVNRIRADKINYDGALVSGLAYSNERCLSGCVPANTQKFYLKGDLPNPGLLVAQHMTTKLREAGVTVTQEASFERDIIPNAPSRTYLYTHYSERLSELVKETNINSNNLYAESLFRYIGTKKNVPGTIKNSQDALREFWAEKGVSIQNAIIKDGCGLAPQDAVSARVFVQVLTYMSKSKNRDAWKASLPVSGESGTLKKFCKDTPLEGRIHAKSGTISGTKTFAGYIDMPNGDTLVFAVMVNAASGKAKNIQTVIQEYLLDVYQNYQ